jgi:hypothetical protein
MSDFQGSYSSVNNPGVECPCRGCIFSGRYGGDSAKRGFLCPYNKRIAFHTLGDIKGLIGSLSALIENIGVAAGIEFKGSHGLSDIGEKNGAGPECPMERVDKETAVGSGASGVGGKVQEHE